ncbi:MAG: DUF975 family protein [Acutalibacteraceae bacterium]
MTANTIIKKQAKGYLQGGYAQFAAAFFVMLIPLAIANALETVVVFFDMNRLSPSELMSKAGDNPIALAVCTATAAVILLVFILSLPLVSGFFRMAANAVNGGSVQCSDLFYYFEKGRYAGTLGFNLSLAVRKLLWAMLSFLPAMACVYLQSVEAFSDFSWVFTISGALFMSLGIVLSVVLTAKYFLAQYLFATAQTNTEQAKNAIALSIEMMKGNRKKYLSLLVSFLPCIALTFFILPGLYTVPYMMVSFADSARWICGLRRRVESEE